MKDTVRKVIDPIPCDYYSKIEAYTSENMVVYKPTAYISGVELFSSDYYHIVLPSSDPPPTKVDSREYRFRKGRLIVFEPETVVKSLSDIPALKYVTICIRKDFFDEIVLDATGKRKACFSAIEYPYSPKLRNLIESFEEEVKYHNESCSLMHQAIGIQTVIQILRVTGNTDGTEKNELPNLHNYVDSAIDYMLAYYNSNIKIEDISRQIHLSPYHFIRLFKKSTGKTPHEFLLSVRISKAEEMLRSDNCTVEEAARLCGFVNAAHFSNYFKRVKAITPSEYRRKYMSLKE